MGYLIAKSTDKKKIDKFQRLFRYYIGFLVVAFACVVIYVEWKF